MSLNAPNTIYAGESLKFRPYFSDYLPSEGWNLELSVSNGAVKYVINASSDITTDEFVIDVLPIVTSTYIADKYTIHARITKNTEVYIINETSILTVKPDPFLGNGLDNRTFNQRMVELIEKVIEKKAGDTVLEMVIGTRQLKHYTPTEQIKLLEYFKTEAAKEAAIIENKSKYSTRFIQLRG